MLPFHKKFCAAMALALALCLSEPGLAEGFGRPAGFHENLSNISDVQSKGRNNDYVKLKGRLTGLLGKDRYEFTDSVNNRIEVELDDDIDWSRVHKDQLIEISGKIEKNMFRLTIEAKAYQILEPPPTVRRKEEDSDNVIKAFSREAQAFSAESDE